MLRTAPLLRRPAAPAEPQALNAPVDRQGGDDPLWFDGHQNADAQIADSALLSPERASKPATLRRISPCSDLMIKAEAAVFRSGSGKLSFV